MNSKTTQDKIDFLTNLKSQGVNDRTDIWVDFVCAFGLDDERDEYEKLVEQVYG